MDLEQKKLEFPQKKASISAKKAKIGKFSGNTIKKWQIRNKIIYKMTNVEIVSECNNAFMYYIEFIKQLKDNDEVEIQFTEVDINLFIFNKIFKGLSI